MKILLLIQKILGKIQQIFIKASYPLCGKNQKELILPISPTQAREKLIGFRKPTEDSCWTVNKLLPIEYDLTIIVPAYNVENYLEECMNSLLDQKTSYRYKIVIVNDGSTDSTDRIAKSFLTHSQVELIEKENGGLSSARNAALKEIKSKYILFVDSDDMLLPGALEKLLHFAYEHDLDIVEGGFEAFYKNKILYQKIHENRVELNDKKSGALFGFSWNKLYKNGLFENVRFNEGYLFEDTLGHYLLYPSAKKIGYISDVTYRYRKNKLGIMNTLYNSPKSLDSFWIMEQLLKDVFSGSQPCDIQYLYEFTLEQIETNYARCKYLPRYIQQAMFVCTCQLCDQYFAEMETNNTKRKILQQSLRKRDYQKYWIYMQIK